MKDKTRDELIAENEELRGRVSALEASETEWRRTEEALQESEERFRLLVEAIPQPIWRSDADGNVIEFNRRWHEYTGQTAEEAKGSGWAKAVHSDEAAMVVNKVRAGITSGVAIEIVNRLRRASDGSYRWHLARAVPMNDRGGKIIGWFGCATDIDDQKRAEEALRQSEQRLSLHFQQTPLGAIEWDLAFKVTRWNPGAERIFGYSLEEAVGRHASFIVPSSVREHVDQVWNDLLRRRGGERSTNENVTKTGGAVLCEWYNTPLVDAKGNVIGVASFVQDITEQERAEEALRHSEQRLALAATGTQIGMFEWNIATGECLWNEQHARLLGLTTTTTTTLSLPYQYNDWAGRVHPDDLPQVEAELRRCMAEHIPYDTEYRAVWPDGSVHWLLGRGVYQYGGQDQPQRMLGIVMDITEGIRAEEALKHAHDELEQKVQKRTAELAIFKKFAEASGLGFSMTGLDGRIAYANSAWLRLVGENQVEDVIGQHISTYCPKEYWERRNTEVVPAILQKGLWQGEFSLVSRDGRRIPAIHSLFPIRDKGGNLVQLGAVVTDITQRKQAEEALRASEERYELAVRGAGVGIWDYDIRTGKLYFSPRWKMIFGYDENDIGDSLDDWARLLHPDEKDWVLKFLEDFLAGTSPTVTVEYRLRHKDGFYRWIVATGIVLRDERGKAYRFVGSHGDITDRKDVQEALRQSHDELRAIYESLGDGLLVADLATLRLVRANAAICSMLGYSEEELLSMSIPALHPKEAVSDIVDLLQRGIVGHLPGKSEVPMLRKDGSVFYADISGDTFTFQGRPCSLGVFRDVTERKKAQEALERERQSLWHMLQASDYERQTISYDIHDGLAQYLAAANMQLQVFDGLRESNPKAAKKAYDAATQLVSQSHAEARRLVSEVRPPIIDEIGLETAISHLVHEQRRHGGPEIECHSSVQFGRLPAILENALYRIVQEALANACKHSKSKKVTVTTTQEGQDVRLEVRDWGIGFDLGSVEKGHFGLEGIRQRVRLLCGRLTIESTPGSGTLVQVVVPIVERQSEE